MSNYRYTSSSYKYSSTGEDESSSTRRSAIRSGLDDSDLSSSVSRTTRITTRTTLGDDEPEISTFSTTRHSTRLSSEDDSFGVARRALDDDSTSRLSRRLLEDDDVFSSKRTKVEVEGGMSGYSMRSTKVTTIDSSGEVKSFESSSKQVYNAAFGGGDTQMLEDSSPIGSIYVAILDYKPLSTDEDGLLLKEGEQVKVLDTSKPRKWKVIKLDSGESGWVGSYCLEKAAGAVTTQEPATPTQEKPVDIPLSKKETLVKELVDTEEDFARDMLFVCENYLKEMDNSTMPKRLREYKEQLFYNFKEICDFHNEQLITGIKFNAREPSKLGTTLLRMERDFDKHVKYVEHESKAQQLLKDVPELKEHLDKFSQKIGDEKTIQEHLKLPLQRINDYQLILKELIKCNAKAGEDFTDLQRALDFMQAIPQRSTDLEFINKMEGYSGNIQKFGRILKETSETSVSEEAGSLKLESKTEGQIIMKADNEDEWSKQMQASTVKSEVAEKMSAEEEIRVSNEEDSTRMETTQEDEANRTTTGVSDLEPRGTSPVQGEKPKFIQTLRGVSIHQNESATLECVIESEPAPALKWLKNNVPVRRGPRITQFSDEKTGRHSLTIINAQPEDAAMYTIVASNPSGTTSCSAPFNVRSASGRPDSRPTSPGGTELPFAPVFKVKLKDTELLEGTSVRFELVVHGCPHPEVTFYKDGEPLQMDERIRVHYENKEVFELIIDHVTEADSAVYSCVAVNSEGCDSTAGCITVTKNKVLFQGLTEDGNAGEKSTTPQPTASPAFTWFRDGREFEASERFQVAFNDDEDTLALVFQHVRPEDAGIYTCVASTFSGKISCSAELTVQGTVNYREPSAPTIEANMEDVEVSEGASAMLELKITGWPKPRIVWTKGEKLIESGHGGKYKFLFEDDESMTLVIRSVTKEDGGRYDVVAENELGSAKTHCNLHVKCPPKFKKELKDASVMTETPLKLDVEVEGVPEPDVKWYKDGQQVLSTERVRLVHEVDSASYALLVDKAKTEDAGSYTCVISNNLGSQSGHAAVTVNSAPKIIKKLESYEATLTETVTFTTKVSGTPKPTVEWLKDGKTVVIDGKKYIAAEEEATVFSLTVDCCGPDDVGAYTVVVKNEFGKAEDSAELTIKIKPKFTKGLADKELVEDEVDIQLSVVVEGKPEPTVSWFHDGVQIKDTKLYATKQETQNGEYTLVIKEAVAEAGGKIQCKAENKHGKAETEAKITVNAKPKITEGLKDQSVVNGADATFTVKYAGSPKPEAKWLKDDAEIQIDGKHYRVSEAEAQFTLLIKECKDDDKGRYKCVVENKFGKDESSADLKVLVPQTANTAPVFIRELENVCCKISERVELIAETKSNPEGTPRWTRNHVEIVDSAKYEIISENGVHKLILKEMAKSDVGKYTLEVANTVGSAASTAEVSIYAPPEFIEGLKNIEATHGESVSFMAVVSGIPEPEITWKRNSETIRIDSVIQGRANGEVKILIIDGASRDHQGHYECVAKNPYGEVSSDAELTLQSRPRFIQKPESVMIRRREQAIFRAKISGDPDPEVTWLKNGVAMRADENIAITTESDVHSLVIRNCGDDDAATYTCVAKNKFGEVSESAELTITKARDEQSAPVFLRKPEHIITIEGEDVCIEAHIVGNPQPQVKWLKNGVREVEETKCSQEGNVFTLVLNKVKQDDEASYTCVASNPLGSVQESASLTIKIPRAPTIEYFDDQQSSVGERIKFSVIVKGTPTPSVTWLRNGSTVEETSNVSLSSMDDSHSLTVKEVTILDFATYSIRAANLAGEAEATANLTEKARRPRVEVPLPSKTTAKQGEPVLLEVKFSGVPNPTIIWLKNGDELSPKENLSISTSPNGASALKLDSPVLADAGSYCAMAENPLGKSSSRCELGVIPTVSPLTFEKPLTSATLPLGKPAKLEAKLHVDPDGPPDLPEITWFKDGLPIGSRHKKSFNPIDGSMALYMDCVSPVDSGVYAVTAETGTAQPATSSAPIHVVLDDKPEADGAPSSTGTPRHKENEEEVSSALQFPKSRESPVRTADSSRSETRAPLRIPDSDDQDSKIGDALGKELGSSAPAAVLPSDTEKPPRSQRESLSHPGEVESEVPVTQETLHSSAKSPEVGFPEHKTPARSSGGKGISEKLDGSVLPDVAKPQNQDDKGLKEEQADSAGRGPESEKSPLKSGTEASKRPIFLWKLEPLEIPVGECIKLKTKVTLNNDGSIPEIDWSKDGLPVPASTKITASPDGSLELRVPKASLGDAGLYRVTARNQSGETETSSAVTVLSKPPGAPLFLEGLCPVRVNEGDAFSLSTRVTLDEEGHLPLIEWFKDDERVDSDRYHRKILPNGTLTLTVDKSLSQDAGTYLIRASNADGEAEASAPVKVVSALGPPQFSEPLSAKVLREGENGQVEAKITPNADGSLPEVSWLKDGKPLNADDHLVPFKLPDGSIGLKFSKADLPDAAKYTAVLTNPDGNKTESSAPVEVAPKSKAPKFEQALQPLIVDEGGSGEIKGRVRPNEDGTLPSVSWLKDGQPLQADDHVKPFTLPDGTVGLQFTDARPLDNAKYTAILRNPGADEEDQSSAPVDVSPKAMKKPSFAQGLKPTKFGEGDVGRLDAKLNPNEDGSVPDIEWLKDGKPLTEADGVKIIKNPDGTVALEIPNCKPSDAGKYTLRAKNPDGGSAESSAPVEVLSKIPVFETQLKGLKLTEGEELKLVCKVKSDTPITAKWFKDGKEVSADKRVSQKLEPDGSVLLIIENCTLEDAGKYRCEVTNQYGTSPSEADVAVQALKRDKPVFIDGLKATAFDEGGPGKLEAKVGGSPKPEIQWLKDGKPISDPRLKAETKPDGTTTLKIDNVKPEDAGEYAIVAKNDQGENKSSAPVTVNKKPCFLKPLESVNVPAGQTAKLSSQVAGFPKPKIEWLKDGKPIKPDGKKITADEDDQGNCSLTIKDCKPEDAGLYGIKVSNPAGEMKSEAPLGVQDEKAPMFLSPLKDQAIAEGTKLVLEAKVMGTPTPEVKWFRNGKPITAADGAKISFDGETARLEIPKAAMTDAGQYECRLASPSGEQSSRANVKVLKPPKFIKPLSDTEVTLGAPLVLECEVLCDDEPEISWTYRGAPIHDGAKYTITKTETKCKLFIANPSVNDCGEFQCIAKNAAGQDSTVCKGTIKEAELKPDSGEPPSFLKKLSDQELTAGSTAKLIACIAGKPEPDLKWFKDGVEVVITDRHSFERDRNGIIRLVIKNLEPNDFGEYRCEISNPHGRADCCCKLSEDTSDLKYRRKDEKPAWKKLNYQISDEPKEKEKKEGNGTDNGDHSDTDDFGFERPNFDGEKPSVVKYLKPDTGIPPSITDAPDIVRMTDHDCTLRWKPSVPRGPRTPVTYRVEMCDHPGGAWKPYASGIKDTTTDVKGLRPGQDYQFRVLVESKHGLSDPSPPVTAHRSKLAEKDDKEQPEKEFKPKDIDLGHDLNKDGCAPYFVRKEEEVMFGVKGRPVSIEFWVYGLPHPDCTWYFKDEKIESGGRYEKIQDRNGQVLLCINRMSEECEGIYTCKAVNVHGEATKSIRLELAEEPHFTKRLEYTTIMLRQSGTLQCRCVGKPYPHIRWYKDWLPIATSGRTKISWQEPDLCIMKLDDSIMRDAGLYSCKATNIAGDATCSATVVVEQEEELYDLSTYKAPRVVRPRTKPFRDYYDLGEELGRGTQGVTYHAVARATGNSYAAKVMHHKDPQFKQWMKNEMDTMNQLAHPKLCRMWDAFESPDSMSLVMDLCGGGELLNNIIKRGGLTEGQVANYIRQTLQGLDYMHARGIGHLGLTLGDILVSRVDADDIKIGDFSLAARIHSDRNFIQEYGHPEYVAPELAKKEPATLASDMWSVGVISYILLSGVSPFLGEHDRETLSNIKDGKMSFLPEGFDGVSDDARDFVAKLMVFEPDGRLNVKQALNHPWLKMADLPDRGPKLGNYERLADYQEKWKKWYANANCRTCFRRRTLESCFYHPSKMIYPPGEPYTPPESPAHREREHVGPGFNYERKKRKFDTENFKNESNYAQGPDTYLLQLRDTDFPLRLRQYMKVGASRSPSLAASLRGQHWGGSDIFARGQEREHIYPQVVIRERRKFHDMMDEEIDDEKKGGDDHKSIQLRLNKEVGAVGYIKNQTDAVRDDAWRFRGVTREQAIGTLPFFREKIDDAVIMDSNNVSFTAVAVGTPVPQFTWFRNDCPLIPTSRIRIDTDESAGTSVLTLAPGMAYDAGVFKCVARNASGTAVCRARLRMGDTPGRPAAPKVAQATSKQMYVEWNAPRQENNARTLFFTLEYKKSADAEWQRVPERITNEFYIVEDLQPATKYEFRVTAANSFGNSVTSDASKAVSTEAVDSTNKIKLSPTHSYQQVQATDIAIGSAPVHDYSREENPINLKTSNPKDEYNFSAELSSGRFSVVMSATSKANSRLLAVKAVKNGKREYDMLKALVHRNIVYLEDAFQNGDVTLLVMERLSMNILAFLTLRNTYTEDQVSRVMKQVLDALEYLHFKGLVFCNVEPDSVCVTDGQSCIVKLVDFGSTHAVPKGGAQIAMDTEPEYMAPEVVRGEPVTYAADVWSAGVLMYILLSGVSPFLGATEAETRENVAMVRFHFESIYRECSSEATKLLIQVFKKCPTKRATIEECFENRWMLPSEYMLRKREACVFQSEKLAQFAQNYERAKRNRDTACQLLSNFGLNRITSPEA